MFKIEFFILAFYAEHKSHSVFDDKLAFLFLYALLFNYPPLGLAVPVSAKNCSSI